MLVEVLLSLQPVAANGHSVIRSIKDVGVFQFAHVLELFEHSGHLKIDVLGAGQLTTDFVSNGALVPVFPYSADRDLVAQAGVTVVKGMLGQPVER